MTSFLSRRGASVAAALIVVGFQVSHAQTAAPVRPAPARPQTAAPRPATPSVPLPPVTGRETTAESVARYPLADLMPVDPEVTVGTLKNGLKYYIRPNGKPTRQAELRLVVRAGSVLEDDDQQGLAHFVEHMQFEGTRHFPQQSIVDFLALLGASIGPDANAVTSFDETQYILRIPTDVPGVVDRALLVLEDWAGGATFDQAGIDRERGIVLSEWRMNLGAAERTQDRVRRTQLEGSRYADRPPIGKPESIQGAAREQLLRFYRDWYRPNLMAVIVVGDVDRATVPEMIERHFGGLTNPTPERPRPNFDVPERPTTRYLVAADKESPATTVRLSNLRPARNQGSVGGYRDIMKDQLFAAMLSARFDELAQSDKAPFLDAGVGRALFPAPRTRDEAVMQALVAPDGVLRGLDALVTELQRVVQFGFTTSELARAKQESMADSERLVAESPDRENESRADEYTRNFLEQEALPTIWQELAFHRRFIPGITLAEMNALTADWFPARNRLIVVTAPDGAGVTLPTSTQLAATVRTASAKTLTRYVDGVSAKALLETRPVAGRVEKTVERPSVGVTEWTLSNGATVVLAPTRLKADQVLFRAVAPGGASLASDADFPSARTADDVIGAGGVGTFNAVALDKLLTGKAAVVRPFIGELNQGLNGGSTPADLETLFQLIFLRFTQPRADPTAFAALKAQALGMLANQSASPDAVFAQTIDAALSNGNPRRMSETPATVARWDLNKSLAFYKARFADASAFTFVFVGSFTLDQIRPFVETYIGSLPATHGHETWRDLGITTPAGIVERRVEKGIAPKSEVQIVFNGPFEFSDASLVELRAMTLTLESRLNDIIRQELGGTYSITAEPESVRNPRPEFKVRIDWTCDPKQTDSLVQRVLQEVAFVRDTRLTTDQVGRVRDVLRREYDRNLQDNRYLLEQIARYYGDGEGASVEAINEVPAMIAGLTGERIQRAAQAYLNPSRYVKVILVPESK